MSKAEILPFVFRFPVHGLNKKEFPFIGICNADVAGRCICNARLFYYYDNAALKMHLPNAAALQMRQNSEQGNRSKRCQETDEQHTTITLKIRNEHRKFHELRQKGLRCRERKINESYPKNLKIPLWF